MPLPESYSEAHFATTGRERLQPRGEKFCNHEEEKIGPFSAGVFTSATPLIFRPKNTSTTLPVH